MKVLTNIECTGRNINAEIELTDMCDSSGIMTLIYTSFALVAFAANSVICRLALGSDAIDAASFSTIRLVSGALALALIVKISKTEAERKNRGSWVSAGMLFLYAVTFSFAYINLSAGTGALILFGSVQATMILAGLRQGERFGGWEWCGLIISVGGLFYLVLPGLEAPSLPGAALMATAGIAWGVYSLRGRGVVDPVAVTGDNFLRSVPMVFLISLAAVPYVSVSQKGVLLAVLSGAVTSGMGYVFWYAALRNLTATRAAIAQLLVPVIAALGGVIFLSEQIGLRLFVSSCMIIGGVGSIFILRNRKLFSRGGRSLGRSETL
jgi:drug/metabolite transporter (DMT)-like permease